MTEKKHGERDDEPDELTKAKATRRVPVGEPTAPEPAAPEPLAITLEPTSGPEHTVILISGANFGEQPGTLALNEVPAPVTNWTPIAISTLVPYGGKTGDLVVTTADGRRGAASFTVTEKSA